LALAILPLAWVFKLLRKTALKKRAESDFSGCRDSDTDGLSKSIQELAPWIPSATCLTQAVALFFLCGRYGLAVELCLGVARDPDGAFYSHAWIRDSERVLIGNEDLLHYQVIYRLISK
jgi:hypothetical protein